MNQWAFVAAAYGVTLLLIAALVTWALVAMRRAEAAADSLSRR